MSPVDRALSERDPAIKGLKTLLDEAAMLEILRHSLPHAGLADARKVYVRYKPGTNCLVRYQLKHSGGVSEIYAKAHGRQVEKKIAKAKIRTTAVDTLGLGRMVIPDQNIVICGFPNDDKLESLRRLFDSELRNRLIERAMFAPGRFLGSQVSQLQYKPERRFVGKLESPSGEQAVIKLYTQSRFDIAVQTARRPITGDTLPGVVGRSKKHSVLILDWIHGTRLSDEYAADGIALSWLQDTGEHLGRFHRTNEIQAIPQRHTDLFISSLYQLSSGISHLVPSLSTWAQSLTQDLAQGIASVTTGQTRIHGDFYAKQVLLTNQGVRFIDLDDICCWFPAYDLGLFIAHLERDVLRGKLAEDRVKLLEHALLDGYSQSSDCILSEVHLFTAAGLMQLAHHPFRNCEQNWPTVIEELLTRCENRLMEFSHAASISPVGAGTRSGKTLTEVDINDQKMPFLSYATDSSQIEKRLKEALHARFDNIRSCSLKKHLILRHKPGKRILIEYLFACDAGDASQSNLSVLGKAREKGLDTRTWNLNKKLFALGFNITSKDGIQVPEPLGVIRQCHMWLQRKVNGKNPFPMIIGSGGFSVARRVAEAIYKLHSSGISVERTHTLSDELHILENNIACVAQTRPEWRARLQNILTQSRQLTKEIPDTQSTGIHRDFYHDQILIDEDKLYLLDLDLYSMGDSALDIGNFVAHIQEQCLREFGNPHYASTSLQHFVNTYCELSGADIHSTVEIYALLTMIRHVFISQRIENRRGFTESILDYCEQQLSTQ